MEALGFAAHINVPAERARLVGVWGFACEVWGEDAAARDFLMRPHAMLGDRKPLDVLIESEIGVELVREILGRLRFGSVA